MRLQSPTDTVSLSECLTLGLPGLEWSGGRHVDWIMLPLGRFLDHTQYGI